MCGIRFVLEDGMYLASMIRFGLLDLLQWHILLCHVLSA